MQSNYKMPYSRHSTKEFSPKRSCTVPSVCSGHREKELNDTKQMEKVKINLHKDCENLSSFGLKV